MYDSETQSGAIEPFPLIRLALVNKVLVTWGGALVVLLLGAWIGYRTSLPDVFVVAIVLAAIVQFALKLALEVIALVAETLMPR